MGSQQQQAPGVPPGARDVVGPSAHAEAPPAPSDARAVLDLTAERIRALWCDAYTRYNRARGGRSYDYRSSPRWDGGADRHGVYHKSIWHSIAMYVLINQIDPDMLVAAQFHERIGPPPSPPVLKSQVGLAAYLSYRGEVVPRLRQELDEQQARCKLALFESRQRYGGDLDRVYTAILFDMGQGLSALFRYCTAARLGLDRVAAEWRPAALQQYLSEPRCYDEAWKGFLASDLRLEAAAYRQAFETLQLKGYGHGDDQGDGG